MERQRMSGGKRNKGLRFSTVDEKNPLRNFKQRCDIIRCFLLKGPLWLEHEQLAEGKTRGRRRKSRGHGSNPRKRGTT